MTEADGARTGINESRPFIDGLFFGECPRWHDGRLWYVDFYRSTVFSAGRGGRRSGSRSRSPGEPAGLGWLPDGRLLVVARRPRTVLRLEPDGQLVVHGDLKPTATFYGNDMVVDMAGRAFVGNFGFDLHRFIEEQGEQALVEPPGPPTPSLIRIDPDGSAHVAATDLSFPNGTVITPDGKVLIVAETLAGRLTAFDVGDDGELSGRRVWASLPWCAPDGICLDAEGRVWVANAIALGVHARRRGRRDRGPGPDLPDLLRLHAGGCRPADPLHDDGADQHRVGGERLAPRSHRAGPGRGGRGRAALSPAGRQASRSAQLGSGPCAGCGRPGRCAARSR